MENNNKLSAANIINQVLDLLENTNSDLSEIPALSNSIEYKDGFLEITDPAKVILVLFAAVAEITKKLKNLESVNNEIAATADKVISSLPDLSQQQQGAM